MATLQLTNLEGNLLEYFKTIATQKGVNFFVTDKPIKPVETIEKGTQETDNKISDGLARPPKNLSEALLTMPQHDDGEDIFAREGSQYSPHREIDWTI